MVKGQFSEGHGQSSSALFPHFWSLLMDPSFSQGTLVSWLFFYWQCVILGNFPFFLRVLCCTLNVFYKRSSWEHPLVFLVDYTTRCQCQFFHFIIMWITTSYLEGTVPPKLLTLISYLPIPMNHIYGCQIGMSMDILDMLNLRYLERKSLELQK